VAAGLDPGGDEPGRYGEATAKAVSAFQEVRGLRVDGICGPQTWSALVEAGWALGDRLLYLRTPPLRGDDVADLQRRLGALGFDAGRVDGILGPTTAAAIVDFQRNAGITVDGTCGPATLAELRRLGGRAAGAESVAGVREREALRRAPRTLEGRRVVVGQSGGLGALAQAVSRALSEAGALVLAVADPDDADQAAQANAFGADVYLHLALGRDDSCTIAYYATAGFTSVGGSRLASLLQAELAGVLPDQAGCQPRGMRLPLLRETRMPAVVCELGPPAVVVGRTAELAGAVARALTAWAEAPAEV
jgi:N-acetylmuramoyl-L-alanine amidase